MRAVPFAMTYHPKLKLMSKVILKYLDHPFMDKEVKRVFTPKTMISFWSTGKLSNCLIRAKLYPSERTVRSYKCSGKDCDVCVNVNESISTMAKKIHNKPQIWF